MECSVLHRRNFVGAQHCNVSTVVHAVGRLLAATLRSNQLEINAYLGVLSVIAVRTVFFFSFPTWFMWEFLGSGGPISNMDPQDTFVRYAVSKWVQSDLPMM